MPERIGTRTPLFFREGAPLYGHKTEWSDLHRALRIDGESVLFFTEVEYRLFWLLAENHREGKREVSYMQMCTEVLGCALDEDLFPLLRKRISQIRKKIKGVGIDIINVTHRGYELRDMSSLCLPYSSGHRAQLSRAMRRPVLRDA